MQEKTYKSNVGAPFNERTGAGLALVEDMQGSSVDEFDAVPLRDILRDQTTPTMVLDQDLRFVFANTSYRMATGTLDRKLEGKFVFDVFPDIPDRVEHVKARFLEALRGTATRLEVQPFDIETADGKREVRYWQAAQEPLRDRQGDVRWIMQQAHDITDRVRAEEDRALITKELDHRTKNILAVVQGMTRMASRAHADKDEFAADLISRIGAMSRNHARLYANDFMGMSLTDLLRDELGAIGSSQAFSLSGVDVQLNPAMARDLSMAVHELATNAAKHGCFLKEEGHLHLAWTTVGQDLTIEWFETGLGPVGPLDDTGFGQKLMRMLRLIDVTRVPVESGLHLRVDCAGFAMTLD